MDCLEGVHLLQAGLIVPTKYKTLLVFFLIYHNNLGISATVLDYCG